MRFSPPVRIKDRDRGYFGRQVVRDHSLGYIIGVYFLFQDLLGELPSRSGDLPPGRITKRQNKCGSRIRRSRIDTFLQCIISILTQAEGRLWR